MEKRKNIENIYPLSPMQQGILFHTLLAPEAGAYVPQIVLTLTGALDAAVLQQVWGQAVNHHDVLRTAFYWEQRDEPFQVVYRQVELAWVEQDWRSQDPDLQATRLQVFLDCNQTQPFNLQTPPLMRVALIRLGDRQWRLIWAYHHLILDGWSAANLLKTIFGQYFSISGRFPEKTPSLPLPASPPPRISPSPHYTTYLTWLKSQDRTAAQTFWQNYLKGFSEPAPLPIFAPISSKKNTSNASFTEQQHLLSAEQTAQLRAFTQKHRLTLNTLMQGAFGLLISRYCDRDDVVFGATCAGRPPTLPGSESMVGLFITTLPIRVQVPAEVEVVPWLQQLQRDRAAASAYEYSSLISIQEWSELPAGQPLFDYLLVVENYPVDAALLSGQTALTLEEVRFIEWNHFPLTLLVSVGERLSLTAKYSRKLASEDAIRQLLARLEVLLIRLTTHAGAVQALPLLTPKEEEKLVIWNQTDVDYGLDCCMPDWIEAQAEKTPDAIALQFDRAELANETSLSSLTYAALNAKANQLAHYLQRLGVGPEVPVAVCVERSLDMVIALLGILKAGGAYVPLGPSYPRDRLAWMLDDAAPPVLITHAATDALQAGLPNKPKRVNLTTLQSHIHNYPATPPPHHLSPDNSIYILYTSGSTGRPKGVINTHRGLVNRLCWMQDAYPLTTADRILQKTPLSFDVSGWELFWPLMTGACLVLAQPEGHKDSAYLTDLIQRRHITTLHFVPAMLTAFLETPNVSDCSSLKRVICSGEALSPRLQTQFFKTLSTVELHNLYGPTEAAIDVTAWDCRKSNTPPETEHTTVPIGHPIANTQIYLLDSHGRSVPPGIPGELHIGGIGVARGYLNQPELTAEKFVPNPFLEGGRQEERQKAEGKRQNSFPSPLSVSPRPRVLPSPHLPPTLYKTGDRARYRPDGALEYLGRIDHQVKLRGQRIELGEIEAVLLRHPFVLQAVVLLREDSPDNPQIVAYVVWKAEGAEKAEGGRQKAEAIQNSSTYSPLAPYPFTLSPKNCGNAPPTPLILHQHLSQHLPTHMLPSCFIELEALPLLPNGKVDRKALSAPNQSKRMDSRPPQTATEIRIANIWQEVLRLEAVGVDDNFFELGGNSLTATRVSTRVRKAFELDLPLRMMFEQPKIADLAVYIDAMQMALGQPISKTMATKTQRREIEL